MNGSVTAVRSAFAALIVLFAIHLVSPASELSARQNATFAPGFLITTDADTLRGQVLLADAYDHSWRVQFRPEGESTFRIFRPYEVYSYGTDGGFTWYSVQGDFDEEGLQTVFIREDITASVTLYSTQITRERTDFFIRPGENRLIYLQRGFYVMQLESVFGECGTFMRNHERAARAFRYTEQGMARAFGTYFACSGETETAVWRVDRFERAPRPFKLGVMAGFNTNNSRITAFETNLYAGVAYDYEPGFSVGVFAEVPVPLNGVTFKPELFFTTRGGSTVIPYPLPNPPEQLLTNDELTNRFTYVMLNLPLMREYEVFGLRPFVQGGVMLGWLTSTESRVGRMVLTAEGEEAFREADVISLYKNLSTGLNLGLGLRVPVSAQQSLLFEGRYTRIFSNIDDGVDSFRTTALELMVGFSF